MPRKPRVWYPGAGYHVMCRGNHRNDIFRDDEDWKVYLTLARETKEKYPFLLHTYCLMTNHVHLHIETGEINISLIMKRLNMLYTQYFNNKYSLVGHLFQDRFRSEEIKSDGYHLYVSKYIHLNPVRAGIVASPVLYPWSSYPAYLGLKQDCLVTTQKILGYFRMAEVEQYQKYVEGEKEVQTSAGETRPRSEPGDGHGLKR